MINFLQAADVVVEQPQQPANYSLFIMIGLMILVLWLFMWLSLIHISEPTRPY